MVTIPKSRRMPDPPHVAAFLANALSWADADRQRVADMLRRARCTDTNREGLVAMCEFLADRPDLASGVDVGDCPGLEGEALISAEFTKEFTKHSVRIGRTSPEEGRKFIRFIDDCGRDLASPSN